MRKFLDYSAESAFAGRVYSPEEEDVLAGETAAEEVEIAGEIAEADRALDTSDALEDLALVADTIEDASTTDVQLVETAVQVAAGPDIEVEEIVPALESYVGRRLSLEGLRETARTIWKNVQEWLKKIWGQIKDFFYKIFGQIPGLRRKVADMRKRVEEAASKKKEETKVTITSGMKHLSVNFAPVKNISELNAGLSNYKALSEDIATYIKESADVFGNATKLVESYDPESSDAMATLHTNLAKFAPAGKVGKLSMSAGGVEGYDGFKVSASPELLGNVRLIQKDAIIDQTPNGNIQLATLERLRRSGMEMIGTTSKSKSLAKEVEFTVASTSELDKVLSTMEEILDNVEKAQRGTALQAAEKARDGLKSACDKMTSAYEKAQKNSETSQATLAIFKSLINLNSWGVRTLSSPATSACQNSLSVVRAGLALVAKNLTAYK